MMELVFLQKDTPGSLLSLFLSCEDTEKASSASQEESPHQELNLTAP